MENKKIFEATEFKNIKEIIYNSAKVYDEDIAFVIKHQEKKQVTYENVSYKRLLEDVNKLGTALFSMGFKGKRIAVIGRNRYEWVISHLANLLGGIVSIPLDKDLQYDELESSLIRSKADCIIFDEKLEEKISKIKENKNTGLTEYVCMSRLEGYKSVSELINKGDELLKNNETDYINFKIDFCIFLIYSYYIST